MTAISKNVYIDALNDIVDEHSNTYHRTIKMKPIDAINDSFAECNKESNEKDPKFKAVDQVRTSKYKYVFTRGYKPNWSEKTKFHGHMSVMT